MTHRSPAGPALSAGTRLDAYEIVALVGEGGMGQVYRAHDTDLDRSVAVKVLQPAVAGDRARLVRFEREARVLASLNHPNVAAIHGVVRGGGHTALVMEFVDGTNLAARIAARPCSVAEAAAIVRQIAAALETAHDKGIVHRDLKPANVMTLPSELVKVLDFGLAKAVDAPADEGTGTTLDVPDTQTGMVLGTAAYMSPEQASGRRVDRRSDIWALGCVWYELLTGDRAFRGGSSAETLAAVLHADPDWSRLPPGLPARQRAVLVRCLAKAWHDRLADASTVRYVLEEPETDSVPVAVAPVAAPRPWLWPTVAGVVIGGVALSGLASWRIPGAPAPAAAAQAVHSTLVLPADVQRRVSVPPALSPDGGVVVFGGSAGDRPQLFMRRLPEPAVTPIDGTDFGSMPFFSPDGQWLGFVAQGQIKRVRIGGGRPEVVTALPSVAGASWGDDDVIVAGRFESSGLWRVPAAGGVAERLTTVLPEDEGNDHRWPQVLPAGRGVLFAVGTGPEESARIVVLDSRTGGRKTLISGAASARYVATGHLVYARNAALLAVPFDLDRLEVTGPAVQVASGVHEDTDGMPEYALAANGSLVFAPGWAGGRRDVLTLVDLDGTARDTAFPPAPLSDVRFSPDGRRVAMTVAAAKNNVWIYDIERAQAARVTAGRYHSPTWTRDGRLVMSKGPPAQLDLVLRLADLEGQEQVLLPWSRQQYAGGWTADGRLVFERNQVGTGFDILAVAPGSNEPTVVVATAANEELPRVSPDGRWLAYRSDESGRTEVFVRSLTGAAGRQQVSTNGAQSTAWAPDGRSLYYIGVPGPALWQVPITYAPSLAIGQPTRRFAVDVYHGVFDVAPDGRRLAMVRRGPLPARDRFELIQGALVPRENAVRASAR